MVGWPAKPPPVAPASHLGSGSSPTASLTILLPVCGLGRQQELAHILGPLDPPRRHQAGSFLTSNQFSFAVAPI